MRFNNPMGLWRTMHRGENQEAPRYCDTLEFPDMFAPFVPLERDGSGSTSSPLLTQTPNSEPLAASRDPLSESTGLGRPTRLLVPGAVKSVAKTFRARKKKSSPSSPASVSPSDEYFEGRGGAAGQREISSEERPPSPVLISSQESKGKDPSSPSGKLFFTDDPQQQIIQQLRLLREEIPSYPTAQTANSPTPRLVPNSTALTPPGQPTSPPHVFSPRSSMAAEGGIPVNPLSRSSPSSMAAPKTPTHSSEGLRHLEGAPTALRRTDGQQSAFNLVPTGKRRAKTLGIADQETKPAIHNEVREQRNSSFSQPSNNPVQLQKKKPTHKRPPSSPFPSSSSTLSPIHSDGPGHHGSPALHKPSSPTSIPARPLLPSPKISQRPGRKGSFAPGLPPFPTNGNSPPGTVAPRPQRPISPAPKKQIHHHSPGLVRALSATNTISSPADALTVEITKPAPSVSAAGGTESQGATDENAQQITEQPHNRIVAGREQDNDV